MLLRMRGEEFIPSITLTRLNLLCKWIHPVVRFAESDEKLIPSREGTLYFIEPVHPTNAAYLDDPIPTKIAPSLQQICDITTYHIRRSKTKFAFQPTIEEVIAQIPYQYLKRVFVFEIIKFPRTESEAWRHPEAFEEGYLAATTRLYSI